MQINQLKAFVTVVAEGGVSAAARALGVAQPTLTRTLQQLEAEVGGAVLVRGPGGTLPTPFGRQLLPHARRLVRSHEKAVQTGLQLGGAGAGDVQVAASAVARVVLLPAAMQAMWQDFPDVRITLAEPAFPGLLEGFENDAIDIAICATAPDLPQPELSCEPLVDIPLVVAMRRRHPLARYARLADLVGATWISAGQQEGADLLAALSQHGLAPSRCPVHFESVECSLSTVAATDMVTLAPEPLVQRGFEDGQLEAPRLAGQLGHLSLCLLQHAGRLPTPAAARLAEGLRRSARALMG